MHFAILRTVSLLLLSVATYQTIANRKKKKKKQKEENQSL
jgi:hypothetical protein